MGKGRYLASCRASKIPSQRTFVGLPVLVSAAVLPLKVVQLFGGCTAQPLGRFPLKATFSKDNKSSSVCSLYVFVWVVCVTFVQLCGVYDICAVVWLVVYACVCGVCVVFECVCWRHGPSLLIPG